MSRPVPGSRFPVPGLSLLAVPVVLILLWLVLFPNVWVVGDSFMDGGRFTTKHYARFFGSGSELEALWASVWISLASVALSAALGVPLASSSPATTSRGGGSWGRWRRCPSSSRRWWAPSPSSSCTGRAG